MGITAEFAKLGARLVNNQWAVSALTGTEMVASLWFHRLKAENGQLVYRDYLGRWCGHGNRLLAEHLRIAISDQLPVRLVIAKMEDVDLIESGGDGSKATHRSADTRRPASSTSALPPDRRDAWPSRCRHRSAGHPPAQESRSACR